MGGMRKIAAILVTKVGVREHRDDAVTLPREEREKILDPVLSGRSDCFAPSAHRPRPDARSRLRAMLA